MFQTTNQKWGIMIALRQSTVAMGNPLLKVLLLEGNQWGLRQTISVQRCFEYKDFSHLLMENPFTFAERKRTEFQNHTATSFPKPISAC